MIEDKKLDGLRKEVQEVQQKIIKANTDRKTLTTKLQELKTKIMERKKELENGKDNS